MDSNPYRLKSTKDVYQNPWLSLREDRVIRPDGSDGLFGVVTMKPGSTVLAITSDNEAVLVHEFKYAIGRSSCELVSGALEEGEPPLDTAKRELEEETGYQADRWIPAGIVDSFTATISARTHMFIALGLKQVAAHPDAGELLTIERVPLDEAVERVMRSEITHGSSSILLLKAKEVLRREGLI